MDELPKVLTESQDLRVLYLHDLVCDPGMLPSFLSHAGCLPRLLWLSLNFKTVLACPEDLRAATNLQVGPGGRRGDERARCVSAAPKCAPLLLQRLDLCTGDEEAQLRKEGEGFARIDTLLQVLVCLPRLRKLWVFPSEHDPGYDDGIIFTLQPKTMQLLVDLAKRGRVDVKVSESCSAYHLDAWPKSQDLFKDCKDVQSLW